MKSPFPSRILNKIIGVSLSLVQINLFVYCFGQNVDIPGFTISVHGISCNSLFPASFSLFHFLYLLLGIPSCLGDANK